MLIAAKGCICFRMVSVVVSTVTLVQFRDGGLSVGGSGNGGGGGPVGDDTTVSFISGKKLSELNPSYNHYTNYKIGKNSCG